MVGTPVIRGASCVFDRRGPDRPDVAVVVGTAELPDDVMVHATLAARVHRGSVLVILLADLVGARSEDEIVRDAGAARAALAREVSDYLDRHPEPPIMERLHHGTLESLLETLEPRFGMLLLTDA